MLTSTRSVNRFFGENRRIEMRFEASVSLQLFDPRDLLVRDAPTIFRRIGADRPFQKRIDVAVRNQPNRARLADRRAILDHGLARLQIRPRGEQPMGSRTRTAVVADIAELVAQRLAHHRGIVGLHQVVVIAGSRRIDLGLVEGHIEADLGLKERRRPLRNDRVQQRDQESQADEDCAKPVGAKAPFCVVALFKALRILGRV